MDINGLDYCFMRSAMVAQINTILEDAQAAKYEDTTSYLLEQASEQIPTLNKIADSFHQPLYDIKGFQLVRIPNPTMEQIKEVVG